MEDQLWWVKQIKRPNSWMKSGQKSWNFLLAIHSHLSTALPWDFYFFTLSQPLTVSRVHLLYTVKEKRGKPSRKPYPLLCSLRIKPLVWELSIMPRNLNEIARSWIRLPKHIEWRWPLSSVNSVLMVVSDQLAEGGGTARPSLFTISTISMHPLHSDYCRTGQEVARAPNP